jgi:hypothetical protein
MPKVRLLGAYEGLATQQISSWINHRSKRRPTGAGHLVPRQGTQEADSPDHLQSGNGAAHSARPPRHHGRPGEEERSCDEDGEKAVDLITEIDRESEAAHSGHRSRRAPPLGL